MTDTPPPNRSRLVPWRWPLHWQILLGLLVGAGIGWALGAGAVGRLPAGAPTDQAGTLAANDVSAGSIYIILQLVGQLFLSGLKLIIVPLVTSSIVLAVANMGSGGDFGRLGLKTLAYYAVTSLIAILIGLLLVDLVRPGLDAQGRGILVGRDTSAFAGEQAVVEGKVAGRGQSSFLDTIRGLVPSNLFAAAAGGDLLGLIVVSLLVGYFLARMDGRGREVLVSFAQGGLRPVAAGDGPGAGVGPAGRDRPARGDGGRAVRPPGARRAV